jgi:hypothetical protein
VVSAVAVVEFPLVERAAGTIHCALAEIHYPDFGFGAEFAAQGVLTRFQKCP